MNKVNCQQSLRIARGKNQPRSRRVIISRTTSTPNGSLGVWSHQQKNGSDLHKKITRSECSSLQHKPLLECSPTPYTPRRSPDEYGDVKGDDRKTVALLPVKMVRTHQIEGQFSILRRACHTSTKQSRLQLYSTRIVYISRPCACPWCLSHSSEPKTPLHYEKTVSPRGKVDFENT